MRTIVVAGIGTGVGKTIISAILVEALSADYWKPVQAGEEGGTDTNNVKQLVSNQQSVFYKEAYHLSQPMSPHAAAAIDGVEITLDKLNLPKTSGTLIVELAGGLMVPLNERELNIHLVVKWNVPVVLISMNYLGSINHTILSFQMLKGYGIEVEGIIFNGEPNSATEKFILNYTGARCLGRLPRLNTINRDVIQQYAKEWKENLKPHNINVAQ